MNRIEEFFNHTTVVDTETTGIDPTTAEIVEIGAAYLSEDGWQVDDELFNSMTPIPFETSAVNFISRRMIKGKPTFGQNLDRAFEVIRFKETKFFVAHRADYDRRVLARGFQRANFQAGDSLADRRWICTFRLFKHLNQDESLTAANLSYLRYALELDVADEQIAHRASSDCRVTGALLEKLLMMAAEQKRVNIKENIGEQLSQLCWQPFEIKKFPFGKHKNALIKDIPTDYLLWLIDNTDAFNKEHHNYDADLTHSVAMVLEARLAE